MKKLLVYLILACIAASGSAREKSPEELANAILQDRVAMCPRVGFAKPNDDVFLMEFDVNLYQAALDSKDKKIKALVAIKAIRSMPCLVKDGEQPLSKEEKEKRFRDNPDYAKLKAWYLELIHEQKK